MRYLIGMALVVFPSLASLGEDFAVGDRVFLTRSAKVTVDGAKVDIKKIRIPATIVELNEETVLLDGKGLVSKTDVMKDAEALAYFTKAIQKDPKNPQYWLSRGLVLEHYPRTRFVVITNEIDRLTQAPTSNAIKDYTEAIRLDPTNAMAYVYRGRASGKMADSDDGGFGDLSQAIKLDPENALAYALRAAVWVERAMFSDRSNKAAVRSVKEAGLKDVADAIRLDPTLAKPYMVRAEARVYLSDDAHNVDIDAAIKDLSEAIKCDPFYAEAYTLRGHLWEQKDEYQKALNDYQKVIALNPTANEGYRSAAKLLATCSDDSVRNGPQAVTYAKAACEMTDWNSLLDLEAFAAASAEVGDFANAVKWQEEVEKFYSSSPKATLRQRVRETLDLYRSNKPYRMPRNTTGAQ